MGTTAVVTGGGRGIGAATVRALARDFDIAIAYRSDRAAAEGLAAEVLSAGRKALVVKADMQCAPEVDALFREVDRAMPPLGALVNCAGILGNPQPVEDVTAADLEAVFATNLFGPFLASREAVRRMSAAHGGSGGAIVNISSVLSKLGGAGEYVAYAASKGALEVLTLGLAREVAADAIRVNAVRAGLTRTDMFMANGDTERIDRVAPTIPMKRAAEPEEIAAAVAFLLSPAASYVTGAVLDVGGGR